MRLTDVNWVSSIEDESLLGREMFVFVRFDVVVYEEYSFECFSLVRRISTEHRACDLPVCFSLESHHSVQYSDVERTHHWHPKESRVNAKQRTAIVSPLLVERMPSMRRKWNHPFRLLLLRCESIMFAQLEVEWLFLWFERPVRSRSRDDSSSRRSLLTQLARCLNQATRTMNWWRNVWSSDKDWRVNSWLSPHRVRCFIHVSISFRIPATPTSSKDTVSTVWWLIWPVNHRNSTNTIHMSVRSVRSTPPRIGGAHPWTNNKRSTYVINVNKHEWDDGSFNSIENRWNQLFSKPKRVNVVSKSTTKNKAKEFSELDVLHRQIKRVEHLSRRSVSVCMMLIY